VPLMVFLEMKTKHNWTKMERIIGRYTGDKKGKLLIVFGGMHGNEKAGIRALDNMFEMLKREKDAVRS